MNNLTSLIGSGLYAIPDAARLIDAAPREIRRWLYGYESRHGDGSRYAIPPLWRRQFADLEIDAVGFYDLLELRLVKVFRKHKVSLQSIRQAAGYARESFNVEFPFACKRFLTDGRGIFAYVLDETGDESLVDMVKRQNVFNEVVGPSLYAGIDFAPSGQALRWYPMERNRHVVLDPNVNFGSPTLAASGVTTATLLAAYKTEGKHMGRVAAIFSVPKKDVEYALRYEQLLAA